MLQPHAVPKDDVLAGRTAADRSSILHRSCHTAKLDSSSVDAPWTWDAARCPEYVVEVDVMVGSAVDFDPDSVIVAAVIAALLAVVVVDPDLAVQIAVAVDGFLPVDSVASQSGAVGCGVKHMLHVVWHCVQSGGHGRFASFHCDRHPAGS